MHGSAGSGHNTDMDALERVLAGANRVASHVAHLALWLVAVVVMYDVSLRSLGDPPVWGAEVSVYLMLTVAFLGAGHTAAEGGHFRVTAIIGLLRPSLQRACHLVVTALGLAFCVAFTVGAFNLAAFAHQLGIRTPTVMKMPLVLLQGLIFVGGLSLCLTLLLDLVRALRGKEPLQPTASIAVE